MLLRSTGLLRRRTCIFKCLGTIRYRAESTYSVTEVKTLSSGDGLEIHWKDGHKSIFHNSWLRFSCQCGNCKQGHSGQRIFKISSLPDPIKISYFSVSENSESPQSSQLSLEFEGDHQGEISLKWLRENCYSESARRLQSTKRLTKPHTGNSILPEVEYNDIINSREGLWKMLSQLSDSGMSLVKNVPVDNEENVLHVARRIGPVQETIYGALFDVLSTPDPINIAYSNVELGFHMDLMYYESPPGLQFLHCWKFDPQVEGGESTFLDSFHVAEELRTRHPEDFESLVRIPATFQKIHFGRDYPVKLVYKRPHIVLNSEKEIVAVIWSPAFEGPLLVPEEDVEPYFKAYRTFTKMLNDSPIQKSLKMAPGDLVCFNNRRILHGRKSFNLNGGVRHLKGCYVNIDEFRNTFQVMSELISSGEPCKRVGNQCFL
ncbi:gamma-butyrobetaine dioxygenase-like [Acropora millepora]|uniref:gamma-butyrobetaine dioxygenase-like n=1 Tax=Acropora millepora TaxID=45264 RepID=UPI001CF2EB54|nr:gamma-butyrobetaine dioxygenase-like [Acropora millepora]